MTSSSQIVRYDPIVPFGQIIHVDGKYRHIVSGGCGSTTADMVIGARTKCTKPHQCVGVHAVTVKLYDHWMGGNGAVERSMAGEVHMVSECYGNVRFRDSNLFKERTEKRPVDATMEEAKTEEACDDEEEDMYDVSVDFEPPGIPFITRAKLVFMAVPTLSKYEAGDEEWLGMSGVWNRLVDALLIFSEEAETFSSMLDFEWTDDVEHIYMVQPTLTNPMHKIAFYFDGPLAFSSNVQHLCIECILGNKPLPMEIEHEEFKTGTVSTLHLFGGGNWLDANLRVYATFACSSSKEQDHDFDIASYRALFGNDKLLFAKMRARESNMWLLAATNTVPVEMPHDDFVGVCVTWRGTPIGQVYVTDRIAKSGKITVALLKKN